MADTVSQGELNTLEVATVINQTTMDKLHRMRLAAMAEAFTTQIGDACYENLTFEESKRQKCLKKPSSSANGMRGN